MFQIGVLQAPSRGGLTKAKTNQPGLTAASTGNAPELNSKS